MEWISNAFDLNTIKMQEVVLRVLLAMVFGCALGLDRDTKNKPIDYRAFMIVALTTCIIAILGQELYVDYNRVEYVMRIDLTEIISGVLTGIGFLGAGAIVQKSNQVVGTATGASIWASGGLGLAIGFGYYGLSVLGFVAVVLILVVGGYFMPKVEGEEDKEA